MATGIDASTNCASAAACLRQAGIDFVGRYYAHPQAAKLLTLAEAQALSAAGLQIVAVWESGSPTQVGYFSQQSGLSDGQTAFGVGRGLGQPSSAPIYFAVDYDAAPADISGPITDYFRGIQQAFAAAADGSAAFPVGVYGSGATCQAILQAGLASYAWLAESSGWTDSKTFSAWNIKQSPAQEPVCGISIDHDEGQGDYGGFSLA